MEIIEHSKRIYGANKFVFYAIADGLFDILSKCKHGITDMLKKKPKSNQISLFSDVGFGWCWKNGETQNFFVLLLQNKMLCGRIEKKFTKGAWQSYVHGV